VSGPRVIERSEVPAGIVAVPVRTALVHPGDDLLSIVGDAVSGIARSGDVIALSETALAIAQGQAIAAQAVRPSKLAYILCRRAGALATVNQPESLQIVIDQVGVAKVLYAVLMHVAGRAIGRRGVFYEILGEAVTAIDGYTGTMPPFERSIVLAPRDPASFAQSVFERTGVACAVVDANDLQRAKVLGASRGVNTQLVAKTLLSNPHGNSDEQTPIVVLKWRGDGASPLCAVA
jgi:hypothetical protein